MPHVQTCSAGTQATTPPTRASRAVIPLEAQLMAAIDAWLTRHPTAATIVGVGGLWLIIFLFFAAIAFGR